MPDPSSDPHDEDGRLFDAYLDAALRGDARDPAEFYSREGAGPGDAPAWLGALHRMLVRADVSPAADGRRLPAEPGLPFQRLGEFRVLRKLGEGGMGVVYLAEQESLMRLVALKVVRPELLASPTALARFRLEARTIAKLRHPGIVTVHAFGEEGGMPWIAMELLPGRSLSEALADAHDRQEEIPMPRILRWIESVARALEAAHAEGVIHRDVKPSNVRITPDDRALLVDFGLARMIEPGAPTITRSFVGSPSYASPEQVSAERGAVDHRTDVYSLGATLYEALTGRGVFSSDSIERLLHRILTDEPTSPRRWNKNVPRDLETVVLKALEKDPARRYASAGDFAADIQAVIELRPVRARPAGILRRAGKWARRNKVAATALAALLVAAIGTPTAIGIRNAAALRVARREAGALAAEAAVLLQNYHEGREASEEAASMVTRLSAASGTRWLTPEEDATWLNSERVVARHAREREAVFGRVMEALSQAQRLDPESASVHEARASFYYERWLDFRGARNPEIPALYRSLVERSDLSGAWSRKVAGRVRLSIETDPPGAEIHLFRYRELADMDAGGERRLVPCTATGRPDPIPPGTWALRVVTPVPGLEANDLVLKLDGKPVEDCVLPSTPAQAQALAGGVRVMLALPAGAEMCKTAAPLVVSSSSLLGAAPLIEVLVDPGWYVAFVRLPGFEDQRVPFHIDHEAERYSKPLVLKPRLLPRGTTPAGFVYVGCDAFPWHEKPFWIMEREVTAGEYLAYLNATAVGRPGPVGNASGAPAATSRGRRRGWAPDADGRFSLPRGVHAAHPAAGVTCQDAEGFAAWYWRAHGLDSRGLACGLPARREWIRAGKGGDSRVYVHGDRFTPKWIKSRFARQQAGPEAVLSFPIDESPYGVYDLGGGVSEWGAATSEDQAGGRPLVLGGSWQEAHPDAFRIEAARNVAPDTADAFTGFRLVLRRRSEAR